MNTIKDLSKHYLEIENRLGYTFLDKKLLFQAFIHKSITNEIRYEVDHNERLEFLGDSVLGLLVAEYLFITLPNSPEGELSMLRSRLVESAACQSYVQTLHLDQYLLLGKGERLNSGRGRETIIANLFEAIIGAIFLDGGLEAAKNFLFRNFKDELEKILMTPLKNWKAALQDYCQKTYQEAPRYEVIKEQGPDHSKTFEVVVFIRDAPSGIGTGTSKKEAQQSAAKDALSKLNPIIETYGNEN